MDGERVVECHSCLTRQKIDKCQPVCKVYCSCINHDGQKACRVHIHIRVFFSLEKADGNMSYLHSPAAGQQVFEMHAVWLHRQVMDGSRHCGPESTIRP